MKNTNLTRYALLIAACGIIGCANTETTDTTRRGGGESIDIGGMSYSSLEAQEASVFGTESAGLSSNPENKPDSKLLGDPGQYEGLELTIEPEENTAFINEIVEYTVIVNPLNRISQEPQFVIVLEKAAGANGALIIDKTYLVDGYDVKDTQLVVKPNSGTIKFRVLTGTSYNNNNKPMYYINVWHVDDENAPLSSALYVRRPAQIGVDKLTEGNSDVQNNLTPPEELSESSLKSATLVNLDPIDQQLYSLYNKKLHVQLEATCADGTVAGSEGGCKLSDETICWTFVETTKENTGYVDEDIKTKYSGGAQFANKGDFLGINHGCEKPDDDGKFWANVYTGNSYNSKYYLNFFHAAASPLTYNINTFALPETLGEPGSTAVIEEDEFKADLSGAETNADGKKELSGCDAAKLLETLDEVARDAIEAKCGSLSDPDCNNFACTLVEGSDGSWALQKDGHSILVDLDGDGTEDLVHIIITQDDEGNTYVNGADTDGDGKVDVPVDASQTDKSANNDYSFICSTEKDGEYKSCSKITAKLDEILPIYVKLKKGNDTTTKGDLELKLIYDSSLKTNNAGFDKRNGPKETTVSAKNGVYTINFWAGTAYDAQYYIYAKESNTKSAYIPVGVINSLNMPTAEGDKADYNEALEPPSTLGVYNPDLGDVELEVAPGYSSSITSPVIKTLDLKVVVKKKNDKHTLVPNEKTVWKVTRGKSINNNATLIANTAETNNVGMATNQFYTGTGYNSVYYVSVFHPNYRDEDKNPIPVVFTVTTANSTGSVPGPTGDPSHPEGDTTATDGTDCQTNDCSGKELGTVNGQTTNPNYPQGAGCGEGLDGNTVTDSGKQGCLLLTVVGDNSIVAPTGTTINVKVRLIWKNGSEDTPIKDNIIWTLDKSSEADGALIGSKTQTDSKGEATIRFKTGSKDTTYRINAYYPNIHDGNDMIPHSIFVAVKSVPDPSQPSELNKINVKANSSSLKKKGEITDVSYYIMSSNYVSCGNEFVFNNKNKRITACDALPSSQENKNQCDLEAKAGDKNDYATSADIKDPHDRFVVYAVANDSSGMPIGYGCQDMNIFTSAKTPTDCAKDDESEENHSWIYQYDKLGNKVQDEQGNDVKVCLPTREINVNISLGDVPMVIGKNYKTKTLVNLGPLMKEGSKLDESLDSVMKVYDRFIGPEPVDKIMKTLEDYFFIKQEDITSCAGTFRDKTNTCYDGSNPINWVSDCPNYSNETKNEKSVYTSCKCFCATMYYWNKINPIGSKVLDLAKKGLRALLEKYLGGDKLQEIVCSAFDGIQFVTLTGDIEWTKENDKLVGSMKYSGANIPFTDKNITLPGNVVEGKWRDAAIVNDTQVSISDYTLNFTYGEFIYELVGNLIGKLDDNGQINFAEIIKCDDIFANLSLPIIGSLSGVAGICEVALTAVTGYTAEFFVNKYAALSMTLQGSADFTQGTTCIKPSSGIGCTALNIENGQWEGTGTLGEEKADGKTADSTLNGIWIGYTTGQPEPEFKYGDKTAEEFMAENSLCRKKMKEQADGSKLKSNKDCLGGYDNISARASSNHCDKKNCQESKSIVVCDENGLVEQYKTATAAEIIKAANNYCKGKDADKASCSANPEIINGGLGLKNSDCLNKCDSNPECQNNASIVVCSGSENIAPNEICADFTGSQDECLKQKSQEACIGKCDEPACVMNEDVAGNCKATPTSEPEPEPKPAPEVIATWSTFKPYIDSDNHAKDDVLKSDASTGIVANNTLDGGAKFTYVCDSDIPLKIVAGKDGVLGAVGTQAVNGNKTSCYFAIDVSGVIDYNVTKIEFDIMHPDRQIDYQNFNPTEAFPFGWINPSGTWHTNTVEFPDQKDNNFKLKFWPSIPGNTEANKDDYKMMRVDNVKVWGIKIEDNTKDQTPDENSGTGN